MCDHCGCETHQHHEPQEQKLKEIELEKSILAANEQVAQKNREHFRNKGIVVFNLISAPGSGKTSLLEATIEALKDEIPIAVIEGDPETERDAERIRAKGVPVVQITTGGACHLDAQMVHRAFHQLEGQDFRLLFIENVGNLVCPSSFDLGEDIRVVLVSVPEGPDKPVKYPASFIKADVFCVTKADLLPYFDFDPEEVVRNAKRLNPKLRTFVLSVKEPESLKEWINFLKEMAAQRA